MKLTRTVFRDDMEISRTEPQWSGSLSQPLDGAITWTDQNYNPKCFCAKTSKPSYAPS